MVYAKRNKRKESEVGQVIVRQIVQGFRVIGVGLPHVGVEV